MGICRPSALHPCGQFQEAKLGDGVPIQSAERDRTILILILFYSVLFFLRAILGPCLRLNIP